MNYIGDSNSRHFTGGLAKYKKNLVTFGLRDAKYANIENPNSSSLSEIMKRTKNGTFIWSDVVKPQFDVDSRGVYYPMNSFQHCLVNIASDINEEYVLLIGGVVEIKQKLMQMQKAVYKFNGSWTYFGNLNKPRFRHNAIYWNGAVYVFGGANGFNYDNLRRAKMEIWKIEDSPDEFKTTENWPELYNWFYPHLFIVPDSFFPDK